MKKNLTVCITRSAGQVGYNLLFTLMSEKVFTEEYSINLRLYEDPSLMKRLEGAALELEDCGFTQLNSINLFDDYEACFSKGNLFLFVGGFHQKSGMSKKDFVLKNFELFKMQAQALERSAHSFEQALVIGNPCNTNSYVLSKKAPSVPANQIFSLSLLDEMRARSFLAKKLGVFPIDIKNVIAWGNHSQTVFPDLNSAQLHGQGITDLTSNKIWLENEFIPFVQNRGEQIVRVRGHNSAGSAAHAIAQNLKFLYQEKSEVFSMGCLSTGQFDLPDKIWISMPCQVSDFTLSINECFEITPWSKKFIQASIDELLYEKSLIDFFIKQKGAS